MKFNRKTYKIKLKPTPAQRMKLSLCAEVAANAYDLAMRHIADNKSGSVMSADKYIKYSRNGLRYGISFDYCPHSVWALGVREAYRDFEKKYNKRNPCKQSFSVYPGEVRFTADKVKFGRISSITLAEASRIPDGAKIYNPRCVLDLGEWYILADLKKASQETDNRERVCIDDKSGAYFNLEKMCGRLSSDISRYEQTLRSSQRYSNNMRKAAKKLANRVTHIQNIIRDMENKYDCSNVRKELSNTKKAVNRLKSILNNEPLY